MWGKEFIYQTINSDNRKLFILTSQRANPPLFEKIENFISWRSFTLLQQVSSWDYFMDTLRKILPPLENLNLRLVSQGWLLKFQLQINRFKYFSCKTYTGWSRGVCKNLYWSRQFETMFSSSEDYILSLCRVFWFLWMKIWS